jgi:hypothetical protein
MGLHLIPARGRSDPTVRGRGQVAESNDAEQRTVRWSGVDRSLGGWSLEAHMKKITLGVATIVWVCISGPLGGCASPGGRPGGPSQQEPSHLGALEQVARQGKDGTIALAKPTWLADKLLKPGRYEFQQRVDRGEPRLLVMEVKHYVQFKRRGSDRKRLVAEVQCGVEALGDAAAETVVHIHSEAGVARVDWITLAGEASRCLPGAERR